MGVDLKGVRRFAGVPILVALVSNALGWLFVLAVVRLGLHEWLSTELLSRADGGHYLSIATTGYHFAACTPDDPNTLWCGNTAWQPLYPLLIRLVSLSGFTPAVSGLLVTAAAGVGMNYLLLRQSGRAGTALWRLALLLTVAPGMVWMHAVFPISLLLLWSALAFIAVQRSRYWLTGVYAALAILTYSSGLFIAVSLALMAAILSGRDWMRAVFKVLAPVAVAVTAWLVMLQLSVGNWRAWWLVQQKYYQGSGGVFERIGAFIHQLLAAFEFDAIPAATIWISVQSWLVLFLSLAAGVAVWRSSASRRSISAATSQIVILGLFPFVVGGALSISRNQAQTVLFFPRLRLDAWAELLLILLLAIVGAQIVQLFFTAAID